MTDMSGIDKIISQIEDDTRAVCDDMTKKAEQKAAVIIADAEKRVEEIRAKAEEQAALKVADIKKRGESAAELEERRILLKTKQGVISDMLEIAIGQVKSLPDDEYFELLLRMVKKYSQPGDGTICFGKKDLSRMPSGYMAKVNENCAGSLTLCGEPAAIDAGFKLIYGGIEENCSFDAIFASEDEALKDKAGKLLFQKG